MHTSYSSSIIIFDIFPLSQLYLLFSKSKYFFVVEMFDAD